MTALGLGLEGFPGERDGQEMLPWGSADVASSSNAFPANGEHILHCNSVPHLQDPSAHIFHNNTENDGQFVPRISRWVRWGLSAAATLCFCPQNCTIMAIKGNLWTYLCTCLTLTLHAAPSALFWVRLWWIEVCWHPASTNTWYILS